MLKIILYLIIGFGLVLGYIKYVENRSVFFPIKEIEIFPDSLNLPYENVYLETKDGVRINGWFIPYENAKYTILFLHGNAGNIGHRLDKISMLRDIGLSIFIIDYRGYGRSEGKPSEAGLYIDAKTAYDYLVSARNIKSQHIILFGESLGTAIAVNLAYESSVGALILEGAFSSARDMAKRYYPFLPSFVFTNQYNSLCKIKEIKVPKLFIHSRDDEIVPFSLAKKLYDTAPEPKYFVEINGGHNTAFLDSSEKFIDSINLFVKEKVTDTF